jgi:CheY-like chemotaxis protein
MLADQMGGGISVQSELGRGSTFCFRAPLPLVTTPSLDLEAFAERRSEPRLRPGLRVLVAEDNRTNMMIVRKMLDHRVKSLAEAGNGAEAVTLYRAAPPDLVLMDMSMPVMDGLRATSEIRAYEHEAGLPRCPIIALTANAFGEDREACIAAGMDSFLTKPLSRLDLLTEIAAHLPERPIARKVIGL